MARIHARAVKLIPFSVLGLMLPKKYKVTFWWLLTDSFY